MTVHAADREAVKVLIKWNEDQLSNWQELVDQYNADESNPITIDLQFYGSEGYDDMVKSEMTSDDPAGIVQLMKTVFNDYAANGQLMELSDLISKNGWDYNKGALAWAGPLNNPDGKVYGIPDFANTSCIFYNTDIFSKLNLEEPTDLDSLKAVSKTIQTMLIMPYFLSWSVVAIVVYAFFGGNGVVNALIRDHGGATKSWYTYKPIWPFLLTFVNMWKSVGYTAIVYVASISGIPQEYYEAAALDGATKVQQARYITLPYLRHIIVIMFIMSIGGMFHGDMGLFFNVTQNNGALYPVTDVIDTYVYRALKTLGNTGMSSAAGLYQSVVGFILVMISNVIVRHVDEDSALF